MAVTKHYSYTVYFDCGIAEITDKRPDPRGTLWHAVFKATCIPGHRIIIKAHEDPVDPCEVGAALRRIEALRHYLVEKSIDAQRIETQVHEKDCCKKMKETHEELCRRAEIHLFPRVESLCPDVGDALLSEREVSGLDAAMGATFQDVDANCKELEGQYTTVEWKRILGHESLRQWLDAGAYHPHFVSEELFIGPTFPKYF
jgi:hypothetical protein